MSTLYNFFTYKSIPGYESNEVARYIPPVRTEFSVVLFIQIIPTSRYISTGDTSYVGT